MHHGNLQKGLHASTYPRQFSDLVGIEQQFLERAGVAQHVVWDGEEVAVALVDVVDLLVAGLEQRQTAQHGCRRAASRRLAGGAGQRGCSGGGDG